MRTTRHLPIAILLAVASTIGSLQAQSTLYWDINNSTAGPGASPLAGYWGTVPNWNTSPLGTGTSTAWVNGSNAVFTATDTGAETYPGFQIQLLRAITLNSVTYNSGQTDALLLIIGTSPSHIINLASLGAFNVNVDPDSEFRFAVPLTGNGYLVKEGGGTLSLIGQQNYLGSGGIGTVVENGNLVIVGSTGNPLIGRSAVVHENTDTYVGSAGNTAKLAIYAGALLSDRNAYIGTVAGSTAFAQVGGVFVGLESLWKNSGTVTIGGNGGSGEVQSTDRGTFAAANVIINDQGALSATNNGKIEVNTVTVNDGGFLTLENRAIAAVNTINLQLRGTLQINALQTLTSLSDPATPSQIVSEGGILLVRGGANTRLDSDIQLDPGIVGGLRIQHTDNSRLFLDGLISGTAGIDVVDDLLGRTFTPGITLSRANTYSGLTKIRNGALTITNTTGSATGSGNVEISGELAGTGSISGNVNLAGKLLPGTGGVGTLTLGSLSFFGNAFFDLGTPGVVGGSANDWVKINGDLSINATLNVNDFAGFGEGTYRLFDYSGALTSLSLSTAGNLPGGFFYTIGSSIPGEIDLMVARRPSGVANNWDGPGTSANAIVNGGNGLWDNTTTNWTNSFGSNNQVWSGKNAIFSAASGTVRLNDNIAFEEIEFTTNNYQILANASYELQPSGQAILKTTSAGVDSALIAAPITGSGGLIKQGPGIISLSGINTYTGSTTLEAGMLDLWGVERTPGVSNFSFDITAIGEAPLRIRGGEIRIAPNQSDFRNPNQIGNNSNDYHLRNDLIIENDFTFKFLDAEQTRIVNGLVTSNTVGNTTITKAFYRYYLDGTLDLTGGNRAILFDSNVRFPVFEVAFVDINEITNGTGLTLGLARPEIYQGNTFGFSQIVNFRGPGMNTYTGTTTVNNGVWLVLGKGPNNNNTIPGDLVVNEGGVIYSYGEQIPDDARVTINSTGSVLGNRNSFGEETFGSLYGSGNLRIDRDVFGSNIGNITFGAGEFSGVILDDNTLTTEDFLQNGITKISDGTFTLTGRGAYNGATLIQGGSFIVNGSLTAPTGGQSPVTVFANARLGGTGVVSGAVTIENGGSVSPGNSPGTLTLGSLLLNPSSSLDFELATPGIVGGGVNDLLTITGDLRLDGFLNVSNLTGFDTGSYRLINYGGTLSDNGLALGNLPAPFSYGIDISTPGQVNLLVNAGIVQHWDGANATVNGVVDGGTALWDTTTTNWTNASGTTNSLWDGNSAIFTGAAGKVTVAENISAKEIRFLSSAYTISVESTFGTKTLTIDGIGVVNNSGITQNFQTAYNGASAKIEFINNSNAGTNVTYTNYGDQFGNSSLGSTIFNNSSSAGGATIVNLGGASIVPSFGPGSAGPTGGPGGSTVFNDTSSAASSTILNYAGTVGGEVVTTPNSITGGGALGGQVTFSDNATASQSNITNFGGTALNVSGGSTTFLGNATAASSTITNHGANAATTGRGITKFFGNSTAENATLIADTGTDGGLGGSVEFSGEASGGNAKAVANAGGVFDFTFLSGAGTTLGSIEGAGTYQLGSKILTTGSRNTDTEVSGSLSDGGIAGGIGGGLTKVGTGTLTLSGTNNYTGATTISAGKLLITGILGNTAVSVTDAATLGGSGTIGGAVTVQNGGILSPGNSPGTLRVASLTLNPTSVLAYELNVPNSVGNPANDLVNVDGNLTLDGLLDVTTGGGFAVGNYRLFNYGGTLVNNGLTITSLPTGFNPGDFRIDTSVAGQVNLALPTNGGGGGGTPTPTGFQYWDGSDSLADGQVSGGSGFWRNSDTNWTNQPGDINGLWAAAKAVFAGRSGLVTLAENISFQQLIFAVNGYALTTTNKNVLTPSGEAKIDVAKNASTRIAAPLIGNGSLAKTGLGTLLLESAHSSQLGSLQVDEGALYLNGELRAPSVVVAPGALLGGGGLQVGNVTNLGTLAPGNSPGTFTINGNYTQSNGGTFALEVASLTNFDRLFVSGTARLNGILNGIELGHSFDYGDRFAFLFAGSIEGKFNSVIVPDPVHLRGRFLVENGVGVLLIAPRSYTQVAVTPNESALGGALDNWIGIESGDKGFITLALDLLTSRQYPAAFESMLPSLYGAGIATNFELSQNHLQLLHQQLSARRLGSRINFAEPPAFSGKDKTPIEVEATDRWDAWTTASGLYSNDGLSTLSGDDFKSGTFLVGADFKINGHFAVGLFGSYQEGRGDYPNAEKVDLQTARAGLYGTADFGPWYLNAAAGFGTTDYSIKRALPFFDRRASGSPNGTEFFTEVGSGYDVTFGAFTVGPQASLQFSRVEIDSFTEQGAGSLNLRLANSHAESLRSNIGARAAYTWQVTPNLAIIPEMRVFWQHEYLRDNESLSSQLDGGSGPEFSYQIAGSDRDSVFLGAGVGFQIGSQIYANLYYNADFGRSDATSHTVSVSANFKF